MLYTFFICFVAGIAWLSFLVQLADIRQTFA